MSLNIFLKRHAEAEINNRTNIDGKWRIEVIAPNGEIKKPFGDKWRKNLIQDRGLNIFDGTFPTNIGIGTAQGGAIDIFIQSAFFGNDDSMPFSTNNIKPTSSNANLYWTRRRTLNVPENTDPYIDDYIEGSRTFRRAWDFPALSAGETRTVKEIVITANTVVSGTSTPDQQKGSETTFSTSVGVISRFVLPEAITLTEFQFLRLYYSIKVTVPAIANPVNITLENNGFNATGQLKLIGLWSSIFSGNGHLYQTRTGGGTLSNIISLPWTPWTLMGRYGCSGLIVGGNENPLLNFNFPSVGTSATILYNQIIDDTQTITQSSPGSSMTPLGTSTTERLPENQSLTREATLLFPANNPSQETPIGGIILLPAGGLSYFGLTYSMTAGSSPTYAGGATQDTDIAASRYFWYWRFTDETFTNPRSLIKDRNYGLAVNLRQTMSRG